MCFTEVCPHTSPQIFDRQPHLCAQTQFPGTEFSPDVKRCPSTPPSSGQSTSDYPQSGKDCELPSTVPCLNMTGALVPFLHDHCRLLSGVVSLGTHPFPILQEG